LGRLIILIFEVVIWWFKPLSPQIIFLSTLQQYKLIVD
jgi:hypothetical protein